VSAATVDAATRATSARRGRRQRARAIGAAEANARNARVSVDFTLIRAPFDGVILSKSANVGDIITPFRRPRTRRARW